MYILARLSTLFGKGENFCVFLFAFLHIKPLLKSNLIREEFALKGIKFFPLRVDAFSKGRQNILTEFPSMTVYQFLLTAIPLSSCSFLVIIMSGFASMGLTS